MNEEDYVEYFFEKSIIELPRLELQDYNLSQANLLEYLFRSYNNSGIAKLMNKLTDSKLIKIRDIEYEVEMIIDSETDEDGLFYLVKWRNWDYDFSTWEPKSSLKNCLQEIEDYKNREKDFQYPTHFRKDKDEVIKQVISIIEESYLTPDLVKKYLNTKPIKTEPLSMVQFLRKHRMHKNVKLAAKEALKEWEKKINTTYPLFEVTVINDVDNEGPPIFDFITDYTTTETIDQIMVGCQCEESCHTIKDCRVSHANEQNPYKCDGTVWVDAGTPIYECNDACKCSIDCRFRVVQRGKRHKLAVFRTVNRGWGLKTLKKIKKGTFVMEYLGEIITNETAENRGNYYDEQALTYLYDLDLDGANLYTIDAYKHGNLSHFINHSCDPNMDNYCIFINNINPKLPRIAFFANKDINPGEELTFDYRMNIIEDDDNKKISDETPMEQDVPLPVIEAPDSIDESTIQDFPDNVDYNGQDQNLNATSSNTSSITSATPISSSVQNSSLNIMENGQDQNLNAKSSNTSSITSATPISSSLQNSSLNITETTPVSNSLQNSSLSIMDTTPVSNILQNSSLSIMDIDNNETQSTLETEVTQVDKPEITKKPNVPCLCKSRKCRGFLIRYK